MTSKMKDYKYCNQLFDMALDIGLGIDKVDTSYQRKTSTKTATDRIKEAFEGTKCED